MQQTFEIFEQTENTLTPALYCAEVEANLAMEIALTNLFALTVQTVK